MKDDENTNIGSSLEPYTEDKDVAIVEVEEGTLNDDFKYTRENLYNVIEKGSDALNDLIDFAKNSQSPRAFEVVAKMIDSITNSNEKLIDNYQKVKNINKVDKNETGNSQNAGTINNIVFNGTTEQLFDAIEDKIKKEKK